MSAFEGFIWGLALLGGMWMVQNLWTIALGLWDMYQEHQFRKEVAAWKAGR